jgi:hypothetical protein|tara:strand:+ start:1939 stop:2106 length:168 start_codon:yes stop_codon:yes gene_type:complete
MTAGGLLFRVIFLHIETSIYIWKSHRRHGVKFGGKTIETKTKKKARKQSLPGFFK